MEARLQLDTIQTNDVSTTVLHSQQRIISAIFAYFALFDVFAIKEESVQSVRFEFVYDVHWDLGHGWSGDMPH